MTKSWLCLVLSFLFAATLTASDQHIEPPTTGEKEPSKVKEKDEKDKKKKEEKGMPLEMARQLAFETEEGTWISPGLSPDGKTLVFDLLGDLYTLPLAGGQTFPLRLVGPPSGGLTGRRTDQEKQNTGAWEA